MLSTREFLLKTECHFNWELGNLNREQIRYASQDVIDKNEAGDVSFNHFKWCVQLMLAYESHVNGGEGAAIQVEKSIQVLVRSNDRLVTKCDRAFKHIVYSVLAFIKHQENDDHSAKKLINLITPVFEMAEAEKAGLQAIKALTFRLTRLNGTFVGVSMLRKAVWIDPDEYEWKIELVRALIFERKCLNGVLFTWADASEEIRILRGLKYCSQLPDDKKCTVLYHLAKVYEDLMYGSVDVLEGHSNKLDEKHHYHQLVSNLCMEMIELGPRTPKIHSFCARRLCKFGEKSRRFIGRQMMEEGVLKFSGDISGWRSACFFYERQKNFVKALEAAEMAASEGSYGMSWKVIYLKVKIGLSFDYVSEINCIIKSRPALSRLQESHIRASYFYVFGKRDVVKAAEHISRAIHLDPLNIGLRQTYNYWINNWTNPLEISYNQVFLELTSKTDSSLESRQALEKTLSLIETTVGEDLSRFRIDVSLAEVNPKVVPILIPSSNWRQS